MSQFHISCTEIVTVSWFKNERNQSVSHEVYFLSISFLRNQSAAVANTGQKESGFSTPDNEKPKAQSCKRTWNSYGADGLATTTWKRVYLSMPLTAYSPCFYDICFPRPVFCTKSGNFHCPELRQLALWYIKAAVWQVLCTANFRLFW